MFCDSRLTKLTDDIEPDYVHFNLYINRVQINILVGAFLDYSLMAGRIDYAGKVYVYSSGMSKEIINLSKEKLGEYGVNENDIVVIDIPEGVPEGAIMVTVWPHYLSVAKVKRVREGSIYAPQLFNINL